MSIKQIDSYNVAVFPGDPSVPSAVKAFDASPTVRLPQIESAMLAITFPKHYANAGENIVFITLARENDTSEPHTTAIISQFSSRVCDRTVPSITCTRDGDHKQKCGATILEKRGAQCAPLMA